VFFGLAACMAKQYKQANEHGNSPHNCTGLKKLVFEIFDGKTQIHFSMGLPRLLKSIQWV
jgi:hypothetical protein